MKPDPVDAVGLRWLLARAGAFRREEFRFAGYYTSTPWFSCTQLARNFAKSLHGVPLSRDQVRRLLIKHAPELWARRVRGESGSLRP